MIWDYDFYELIFKKPIQKKEFHSFKLKNTQSLYIGINIH